MPRPRTPDAQARDACLERGWAAHRTRGARALCAASVAALGACAASTTDGGAAARGSAPAGTTPAAAPSAGADEPLASPFDPTHVPPGGEWWCFEHPEHADEQGRSPRYSRCVPTLADCKSAREDVLRAFPEREPSLRAVTTSCRLAREAWCATRPVGPLPDGACPRGRACDEVLPRYFCAASPEDCSASTARVRRVLRVSGCRLVAR